MIQLSVSVLSQDSHKAIQVFIVILFLSLETFPASQRGQVRGGARSLVPVSPTGSPEVPSVSVLLSTSVMLLFCSQCALPCKPPVSIC